MTQYRLRVETQLHGDTSGPVTHAVDALGGDVVSVALREVDDQHAVDEIVVEIPGAPATSTLSRALENQLDEHAVTTLLSSQRGRTDEPVIEARHWARATSALDPRVAESTEAGLIDQLCAACPLSSASVRTVTDVASLPVVRMALARGGPVAHRYVDLTDTVRSASQRPSRWLLAVADHYPKAATIALLSRPLAWRFTASEAARAQLLMDSASHAI